MISCLNLCEILNEENAKKIFYSMVEGKKYDRIYFGSYFCSRYFLNINFYKSFVKRLKEEKISATLVIPVFTENDLNSAKQIIDDIVLCECGYIDEITVNDEGMLNYVKKMYKGIRVNIGRLLFKEARDVRVTEYDRQTHVIGNSTSFIADNTDGVIEIDEVGSEIVFCDDNLIAKKTGVHYPLCFVTTGNICKYASIHLDIEKKFRPNSKCRLECQKIYEQTTETMKDKIFDFYRIGRTVYVGRHDRAIINSEVERQIYFPFFDLLKLEG